MSKVAILKAAWRFCVCVLCVCVFISGSFTSSLSAKALIGVVSGATCCEASESAAVIKRLLHQQGKWRLKCEGWGRLGGPNSEGAQAVAGS